MEAILDLRSQPGLPLWDGVLPVVFEVRSFLRTVLNPVLNILCPGASELRVGSQLSVSRVLGWVFQSEEVGRMGGARAGVGVAPSSLSGAPLPSPDRDAHLVARAQAGDKEAFRQLVVAYKDRIHAMVRGMVRNEEDARDLTQEVFVKAWTQLVTFQGQSSFYTWLYRIAVNLTIDLRRKQGRRKESLYEDKVEADGAEGAEIPDPHSYSPQRAFLDKELGVKIREAMNSLSEEQRTAVVLRELEGLSYKEIADIVGCSQGTVMSRLFYGRKRLQEILKDFL